MKKLLPMMVLAIMISSAATCQDFKKFKVGVGVGYAVPSDGGGGVLLYLEPMYRVTDAIAIGLRLESAAVVGSAPVAGVTVNASAIGSYTLNGQYYFSNNAFRPFVGAGLGMYSLAAATTDIGGTSYSLSASATAFGFYPRIGFDYGHFNLSIDYNLIPAQETQVNLGGLGLVTNSQNNSYIGIRLGVSIGGGTR